MHIINIRPPRNLASRCGLRCQKRLNEGEVRACTALPHHRRALSAGRPVPFINHPKDDRHILACLREKSTVKQHSNDSGGNRSRASGKQRDHEHGSSLLLLLMYKTGEEIIASRYKMADTQHSALSFEHFRHFSFHHGLVLSQHTGMQLRAIP